MTRSETRPERSTGGRDVISAWIVVAVLLMALALVPAFNSVVSEGARAIAELR